MDNSSDNQQEVNTKSTTEERRREYHRKYYHDHVDLIAERIRKQKFYAIHRDEILAKAKARYQKKKLLANGIEPSINVALNE